MVIPSNTLTTPVYKTMVLKDRKEKPTPLVVTAGASAPRGSPKPLLKRQQLAGKADLWEVSPSGTDVLVISREHNYFCAHMSLC